MCYIGNQTKIVYSNSWPQQGTNRSLYAVHCSLSRTIQVQQGPHERVCKQKRGGRGEEQKQPRVESEVKNIFNKAKIVALTKLGESTTHHGERSWWSDLEWLWDEGAMR